MQLAPRTHDLKVRVLTKALGVIATGSDIFRVLPALRFARCVDVSHDNDPSN